MNLKFVWADGQLGFANDFSKKHHRDIIKSMIDAGQIQPPIRQYVGGTYSSDNFHGPAFDNIKSIWKSGDNLPNDDELRYMIQNELNLNGREAAYEKLAADVEDTEPAGALVGFLRDPHKELYPNLFRGEDKIAPDVAEKIKNHVLQPLSGEFKDPDKFIYFTIYGDGLSYNWSEDGDLDVQMWVDIEKYHKTTNPNLTIDDLLADIRRVVQTVNFPSFAELGLTDTGSAKEQTTAAMLIQYYPKSGTGSKDENLASNPYACYDLETGEWLYHPKPIKPDDYVANFKMLWSQAKDIALQTEALLGEYNRNILNWQFWFAMYQRKQEKFYQEQYMESMKDAEQEKIGIRNLFEGVFGGRSEAYSPGGKGIYDPRDNLQKLLEIWGIFQELKHFARAPLPWDEQEMPDLVTTTSRWKIASVSNDILFAGGATLDPVSLIPVRHDNGFYVSVAGRELVTPTDLFNDDTINNYLAHMTLDPHEYLGAWVSNGEVYLDATKWIDDLAEAMRFGVENGQHAIWDIEKQQDIPLPRVAALNGLPQSALGPHPDLQNVAQSYMQNAGLSYNPPQTYQRVDPQRAQRIAETYDQLQHNPNDPRVRASYGAMINETMAQYNALRNAGYNFEFYPPDHDPYPSGPRAAIEDLRNNKHMYVYPTSTGYGQGEDTPGHPLLGDSGEQWNGHQVTHNDIFRAVHDAFGHGKEGVGFRADGEENAWRQHSSMYSPVARPAMTAETRGQNSWVNFGPHGESNQNANQADTIYAPQKAAIMPDWAVYDGAHDGRIAALRKVAVWGDIMEKAQRLRDNGQVQVNLNTNNHIVGVVQGDHGTYNTEIWRDDPNSGTITLWNCFLPGTPITMADGTTKPIEMIQPGELVLTHKGNLKPVVANIARPYQGQITSLKLSGIDEKVIATNNHRMWTGNSALHLSTASDATRWRTTGTTIKIAPTIAWKEIQAIEAGDYLSMIPYEIEEPLIFACSGTQKDRNEQGRFCARETSGEWEIDEDIAYLLGWYTAEGYIIKTKTNRIGFSLGPKEIAIAETLSRICVEKFGTPGTIRLADHTIDFRISHFGLRKMVEELIGTGAKDKRLNERIMKMPVPIQEAFMKGWVEGDGNIDGYRTSLVTISPYLISQARLILARLGYSSSYSWNDFNFGNGFVNNCNRIYKTRWSESNRPQRFFKDGTAWYRIESTQQSDYNGTVYDLSVADDHSFHAFGTAAHNCDCPWSEYSWGRTRKWKKYEGRPCAHTLALYWTSLGTPIQDENQQTIPGIDQTQQPSVDLNNAIQQTIPGQQTPAAPQSQPMQQPDLNAPAPDLVTPQQAEQMTIAFPGALAKWRKEGQFLNGDYVRANLPVDGYDDRGTYYVVPRNMIGEVLWADDDETIAIFSIESGPLGPHNVKVQAPTDSFLLVPRTRGQAPRRR